MGLRGASFALTVVAAMASPPVRADSAGYSEVRDAVAEDGQLRVVHHHDWSEATRPQRWKMISGDQDPFGPHNDYSWLTVTDSIASLCQRAAPLSLRRKAGGANAVFEP